MPEPRRFTWGTQVLPDPDPTMTPEEVRDYYATFPEYAQLTTAAVQEKGSHDGAQIIAFAEPQTKAVAKSGGGGKSYEFVNSQGKRG